MAALRGDISFRYLKTVLPSFYFNITRATTYFLFGLKIFLVCLSLTLFCLIAIFIPPLPKGEWGILSFRPSKIFFVAFFSVTVDGRNLIFGHKRYIGIPYCG